MKQVIFPSFHKLIYSKGENRIYQYFGRNETVNNCELASAEPFLINSNNQQYLITSDINVDNFGEYENVLFASKKPTKKNFESQSLTIKRWLKNPAFINLSSDEVVASWKDKFKFVKEDTANNIKGLRPPQIGALYSILAHVQNADNIGIVVMPTGTGKTETMLCTLIANQCKKVIVTVPSDSLRSQLANKFLTLGLLKEYEIIDANCLYPIVGILNSNFQDISDLKEFVSKVNVVVTTMNILTKGSDEIKNYLAAEFSHLFIDEAHHSEADTWKELIGRFSKEKVLLFTATPYRNDGKKLDGKFIFDFSLKKAQQQKYYKKINIIPVREYDKTKADEAIANKAVERLRADIALKYKHILMARCKSKDRAKEVFEYYKQHEDLKPVLIYTGVPGVKQIITEVKKKNHSIIVCVDMLGEGFDLPELKIAAIHDERQSLPISLQFIGRFTRTSYDELGEASFITNLAYPPIQEELDQLYARDADWNLLLPMLSEGATQKEINFNQFLEGFTHLDKSNIPFQSIIPAMSAVVYRNGENDWKPNEWKKGIANLNTYEHQYGDYNPDANTLVIILGKVSKVDWGNFDTVQNVAWNIIVVFWDIRPSINRVYINTSLDNLSHKKLVQAIFGDNNSIINGMQVFRIFHEVHQLILFTVGIKKPFGKDVTYQSFFGKGVEDGIKFIEQNSSVKHNIFGVGYKDGEKVTLGCSVKGKIWSYLRGNLDELTGWCRQIGDVLENENIDPNTVLKYTLVPKPIAERPPFVPIAIEWDQEMFAHSESRYEITIAGKVYNLSNSELSINTTNLIEPLWFEYKTDNIVIAFDYLLGEKEIDGKNQSYFEIIQRQGPVVNIKYGDSICTLEEFFNEHSPTIYFADNSQLYQNLYLVSKETVAHFPKEELISDAWTGVSLNKESQGVIPYVTNSIQYYFISKIQDDYDIIYDDDGSGEIADIVAMNNFQNHIDIHLYHLKYAKGGKINNEIENFYQVCGQAQKSIKWKYKKGKELFEHMLRRKSKLLNNVSCDRLLKGNQEELEQLLVAAKWKKELNFYVYIVQPSLSKANPSEDILILLGNTHHYLHTVGNIELKVYTSE